MGEWSEGEAFGEIRSLVSRRPGADAFARVCELIDEAEEHAPGLYASRWRGYLASHLERWQPRQCSVRLTQRAEAIEVASAPWAGLVKGVELARFDLSRAEDADWVAGELRDAFPRLEHLGVQQTSIRKAAIASACETGVFDELSSLSLDDCSLHLSTLNVLMERLEERDEVEHLRFAHCGMGAFQLFRVCRTSLAPRLRSLGLPDHVKFKRDEAEALAERASEFERLERLDLSNCKIAGSGTKALAEAAWGGPLMHLGLHRNGIRAMGIKALSKRGLLGSLVDEGGEKTLDLSSQQIGNRGLEVVFGSGVLEGVEHLNLLECNLSTLASFANAEDLMNLRTLQISGYWGDDEDGSELLEALNGMEQLQELMIMRDGLGEDFMERLCASPGAQALVALALDPYAACNVRDVEALLDWEQFPRIERLRFNANVPAGHEVIARAMKTGLFRHITTHRGDVNLSVNTYYDVGDEYR